MNIGDAPMPAAVYIPDQGGQPVHVVGEDGGPVVEGVVKRDGRNVGKYKLLNHRIMIIGADQSDAVNLTETGMLQIACIPVPEVGVDKRDVITAAHGL